MKREKRRQASIALKSPKSWLVGEDSLIAGQSLADLRFRQRYGVTLVGILRDKEQITAITPVDRALAGDYLIVMGSHGYQDTKGSGTTLARPATEPVASNK